MRFSSSFTTRDLVNWPQHNLLPLKVSRFREGASPPSEPGRASDRCCHGELGHFALIRTTTKYGLGVRRICRTRRSGLKSITISQCRKQRPKGKQTRRRPLRVGHTNPNTEHPHARETPRRPLCTGRDQYADCGVRNTLLAQLF